MDDSGISSDNSVQKINKNHILILMTSMFFMGMAGTDIYISALPLMVNYFHSSPNIVNITLSIYTIGSAVFVFFADLLSSRFGRKPIIILAITVFTVTSFLISISGSIWLIIVLRFVQAMMGFVFVCSRQVLKDVMDQREQIRANGIILAGLVISPAISPVIGAYLTHIFGWRSCFVFNGIVGLVILFFTFKILPETNIHKSSRLPSIFEFLKSCSSVVNDSFFLNITIIYGSATGAFFAFVGISSYLFIDYLNCSPITYSYIYVLMAVSYLVGNQFMLSLNRFKASYTKIISIGVYCTLIGAIAITSGEFVNGAIFTGLLVIVGSCLMRAANALTNPTTQVITINYFKKEGGLALGIAMSFNYAMMSIAIAFVTLFHRYPLEGLIISSILFSIIGIVAFYIAKKKITRLFSAI